MLFAITQLDDHVFFAHAWALPASNTWLWRLFLTDARILTTLTAYLWRYRLTFEFRVGKMMVSIYKVISGEVFFAVKQSCTVPDNLLKLNH